MLFFCMNFTWFSCFAQVVSNKVASGEQNKLFPTKQNFSPNKQPTFKKRGFYLHGGWTFNYPFAIRAWNRKDYGDMFNLLSRMGFDQVGLWPLLEAIPMPLSQVDKEDLTEFKNIINDAKSSNLDAWLILCPNITAQQAIANKPWSDRNPWAYSWNTINLNDTLQSEPYLSHRSSMLSILNNADAYVTIDGDPGGYPGSNPEDLLKVFVSDRATIDKFGINPIKQEVIPWIWCGWGTDSVWGGDPNNPPERIKPYVKAELEVFKEQMPEPWSLLTGRSHRESWANGRENVLLADSLDLIKRSTLFLYEAIEFEPTPPATVLQFNHIRRILKQEAIYAETAKGVFGNAQQPIIVLPNLYFFSRGSIDLTYLDKSDNEVLKDFADFLGGPAKLLVPAWDCLRRNLKDLPADLPNNLRKIKFSNDVANYIPGGSELYLDILAQQVEARIGLLKAISAPINSNQQAAENLTSAISHLMDWWKVHGYMQNKNAGEPISWVYIPYSQVFELRSWCLRQIENPEVVKNLTVSLLDDRKIFSKSYGEKRINELFGDDEKFKKSIGINSR